MFGAANFNDVVIAGFVLLGVVATASVSFYTARQVKQTKQVAKDIQTETTSPNGESTATAIYEMRKAVVGLTVIGAELKTSIRDIQLRQVEHTMADDERFTRLYNHLGLEQE